MKKAGTEGTTENRSDAIYRELKEEILLGVIPPSTVLSQNDLARRYNVSRSPVRDALKRLEQEQLIQLVPKVGALVKPDDYTDAIEVTEIRRVLEGYVAKKLAHQATYEDVSRLRQHLEEVGKAVETGDIRRFYDLEREFHRKLVETTGNKRLVHMISTAVDPICSRAYLNYVMHSPEAAKVMHREHLDILQAIEDGDGDRAQAIMRKHIERMHAAMMQMAGYQHQLNTEIY